MLLFAVFICILSTTLAQVSPRQKIQNGLSIDTAECNNGIPAFFAVDNAALQTKTSIDYEGVSERQCLVMCTDNRDIRGRQLVCASISYEPAKSMCRVYRVKSIPDGDTNITTTNGVRYFEKFCLPVTAPLTCGEAVFRRTDQKVLVGFARNVSIETSLEACVRKCLDEQFPCVSAVFFYEAGECITNTKTAADAPDAFVDEKIDRVVYFDNGCSERVVAVDIKDNNAAVIESGAESPSGTTRPNDQTIAGKTAQTTRAIPTTAARTTRTTTTTTEATTTTQKTTTLAPEFTHKEGYGQWTAWSKCDRPDGRRIRRRECVRADKKCTDPLLQVQWCSEVDPDELTTTTVTTTVKPTTTTTAPSTTTRATTRAANETVDASQAGWGEWRDVCQHFVAEQPCENGQMIGFQTRPCTGSPGQCDGPFFRYCTLPC